MRHVSVYNDANDLYACVMAVSESVGVASVPLSRGPGTYGAVSVRYTATSGTASIGSDFLLPSLRVVIPDGIAMATINVTIVDDEDREFAETFQLNLLSVTGEWVIRETDEESVCFKLDHGQKSLLRPCRAHAVD